MATRTARHSMRLANGGVKKSYIGRRTGKVINIVARRNANGFENIDDYFPDSDLENEENTEKGQTPITTTTTTSTCEVSGKGGHCASGENVDLTSDCNVSEPATKSIAANSLEERCSPDSAFDSPKDDVPTSDKVGCSADKASVSQSSLFNGDVGRYKHGEKNGGQVLSGNNISLQNNGDEMAVNHSSLDEEEEEDEMHTTKKRLRFSISPQANEKEKSLLLVEKAVTNKDQDGNVTDEEDSFMVVEKPKTRAPRTTPTKKTASHKKATKQARTNKRPQIESDSESSIEDICKSNDTFLTLKKKSNVTASKLDSNNNDNSTSTTVLLSAKPPASQKNTKSKIPVRKTRSKICYPKRNTRKNVKTTETTQGEENSKNLEEEEEATVSKVQITSNLDEFLASEIQDLECSEDNKVGNHDEMSVQSEPEPAAKQSQRLAKGPKNNSSKLEAGAKSGKTVVKRKPQNTETAVGKSAAKKKVLPVAKPSVVKTTKRKSKPTTSAAKARVTRNSTRQQNTEHSAGSSEESLDKASPIKAPSINIEKDGQSEIVDEHSAGSSEESLDKAGPIKAPSINIEKDGQSEIFDEHSAGSSEESLDKDGPIKAPSINIEKDGQSEIFDDCLTSDVCSEVVEEEAGVSVEESSISVMEPPKSRARKVNLESVPVTTQATEEHEDGLRRSNRNRVPPLQYWKNERIEYERRKSGWIVKDVIINPSPQVVPRKRKNTTKYVTSHAKKRAAGSNFEESELSLTNVPEGLEEEVDPVGTVFNPDLMEQVKMKLVHSSRMLDFQSLVQDTDDESPSLLVHKFFSQNQFGAGQVLLRPGAEKGRQHVRKDTMVFHIISGRLLVTIQDDSFVLARGSSFFIPHGNVYNMKNLDMKKDACLFFTQLKGS